MPSAIETAIHEAAHAVAFSHLFNGVSRVTILPSLAEGEELGGSTDFKTCKLDFDKLVVCVLAGPIAATSVGGDGSSYDLAKLAATARQLNMDSETFRLRLSEGAEAAAIFVQESWPAILRLADVLVERKTLNGEEVEAILAEFKGELTCQHPHHNKTH